MTSPTFDLTNFRFYDDDGTGEDDQTALGTGNNQTLDRATTTAGRFCVRVEIHNDNAKAGNEVWEWEYSYDGGAWTPISISSNVIRAYDSANLTEGEDCTQRLTAATPWLVDNNGVTEDGISPSVGMGAGDYVEALLSCYIVDADVADGIGIDIRVVEGGGDVVTYTNTPSLTVDQSGIIVAPSPVSAIASTINPTVIVPGLSVLHYRVRNGDTVGLNVDSDWKWALDTDGTFDAGTVFRVRVELENAAGTGAAKTFKLQYKLNAGAWTDVTSLLESATTGPIMSVPSSQFTDLDATTNLISGSTETFEAGQGLSDNPDTSAITLISEHTEYEWALLIEGFYDGPTQISDGDTIALRVVETDNTLLDSYPLTPTFTVNVPDFYIGGCYSETPARAGPIADADGNLYWLMEPAETDNVPIMVKSTDGGRQWTLMDDVGGPTTVDLECHDMFLVGDTIHILQHSTTDVVYHAFLVSTDGSTPDTWSVIDQSVRTGIDGLIGQQTCALARRSDGDLIAFYNVYVAGPNEDRLFYKINDGTWGSELTLEDEAGYEWHQVIAVVGASDLTHIFYKGDNGTLGPIWHRSLSSADSLSAREAVDADSGPASAEEAAMTQGVYWNDGGNEKIMVVYKGSDDYLYSVVVTDDGTPETPRQASDNTVIYNMGGSRQPTASLVLNGDDAYLHYADAATLDIYRTEMVNDGGWNTDVEELDAVTAHWIRGLVFTHSVANGSDTVVGYAYDNGSGGGTGYIFYDEFNIAFNDSVTPTPVGTIASGVDPTVVIGQLNGFHQPNFRFRAGDTDTLNGTTDWKWALNVDGIMDAGVPFRVRFEVAEYNSLEASTQFKLQYRINAGTWTDVGRQNSAGPNTPVIAVLSGQYTDLDPTTDILSGSSETFEAGQGLNDDGTDLYSSAITLNGEHTEYEWKLMVLKNYYSYQEIADNDEIELRIVETDDTVFTGTYNIPTITVNVPDYFVGGCYVESPGFVGPIKDDNGNLYFIIEHNSGTTPINNNTAVIMKSTDGGVAWAEVDGANRPAGTDFESGDTQVVGDTIHFTMHKGSSVYYNTFNMSTHGTNPDEWVIKDEVVITGISETDQATSIAIMSDGDVWCFYRRTEAAYERLYYKRRNGTWGSETALDAEANTSFSWTAVIIGDNDLTHIFYQDFSNGIGYHRSLSAAGSLSGREVISTAMGTISNYEKGFLKPIYWDDAGDEKIMVVYNETTNDCFSCIITNDGTPAASVAATDLDINRSEGGDRKPVGHLVGDGTGKAWLVYSDLATEDLWLATYSNGAWGTDVELEDGTVLDFIQASRFTHSASNGGNTVLGIVVEYGIESGDDGYIWYLEEILGYGEVLHITVDDGTLDEFDTTAGEISATANAAMVGAYGIQVDINDLVADHADVNQQIITDELRFRIYFDPNNVTIGSGDSFPLLTIRTDSTYSGIATFGYLMIQDDGAGNMQLRMYGVNDLDSAVGIPTWTTISDVEHYVEVYMKRETADGQADGIIQLWIDGVSSGGTLSTLENFNVWPTLDEIEVGPGWGYDAGVSGTIYLDDLIVRDDSTEIGPVVGGDVLVTPTPVGVIASKVDPTVVLGSTLVTPTAINSITVSVNPTVVLGSIALSPTFVYTIASKVDPTVELGSISATPTAISAISSSVDPFVIQSSLVLTANAINSIALCVDPLVILGNTAHTPTPASGVGSTVDPFVIQSSLLLDTTPLSAITSSIDPTVIKGSLSLTPSARNAIARGVDPTVLAGADVVFTPDPVSVIANKVDPTVELGSTSVTPTPTFAIANKVDPSVLLSSTAVTPSPASTIASKVDPTVIQESLALSPAFGFTIADSVDPTIVLGSIVATPAASWALVSTLVGAILGEGTVVTPAAISSIASSVNPTVALGSTVATPSPVTSIGNKVDPTVVLGSLLLTPTPVSVNTDSVPPTTVLGSLSVTPSVVSCLTGKADPTVVLGSTSLTPGVASAIGTSVNPTVLYGSTVAIPNAVGAVATGVDPNVLGGGVFFTPTPVSVVAGKVDPTVVLSSVSVTPVAANAVASAVDPTVLTPILLIPTPVSSIAGSIGPSIILGDLTISPLYGNIIGSTVDPTVVQSSLLISSTPASAIGSGVDPTVVLGSETVIPAPAVSLCSSVDPVVVISSGDLVVTPAWVSTIASTVDPTTILSSMVVAPTSATTIASSTGPIVQEGALLVTPSPVTSVTSVVPPIIVQSSMVVTPTYTLSIASTLDPTVVLSSTTATPSPSHCVSSSLDPTVVYGALVLTATPAQARASSIDPAIILGSIALSPDPATAVSQAIMFAVLLSGAWFDEVRADLLITKEVDHDLYVTQEVRSDLFLD